MNNTSNKNKKVSKKTNNKNMIVIVIPLLLIILFGITKLLNKPTDTSTNTSNIPAVVDSDLTIPISDITEDASFYPVEIDGTKLEVLAVKAEDGTIRTAFNTCQVCYSSGRGYYEQEGDKLVCQNCGNQFTMSDVEISKGGCNPVPIFSENKTVTDSTITISKDYLTEAKVIFENWKN